MNLFKSWLDGLRLLKPGHLKLFSLVTLKSIGYTYKIMLKQWWWLWFGALGLQTFLMVYKGVDPFSLIGLILFSLLNYFIVFLVILSSRASVDLKNYRYFLVFIKYFFETLFDFGIFRVITGSIFLGMVYFLYSVGSLFVDESWFFIYPTGLPKFIILWLFMFTDYYFSGWYVIISLSVCDFKNYGGVSYPLNSAAKMLIYNYPILLFFFGIIHGCITLIDWGISFMPIFADFNPMFIVVSLLSPIFVCIFTNVYIKRFHDQPNLYLPPRQ